MAGHLLGPLKWGVGRPAPRHAIQVRGLPAAHVVQVLLEILEGFCALRDDVHVIEDSLKRAFATAAVVTDDKDHQRVVGLAHVFDGRHHASEVVVHLGQLPRGDFHHPRHHFLLPITHRIPARHILWPRRQLRIRGDNAHLFLTGKSLLAQLVPPLIKFALVFGDPLGLRMLGGMNSARCHVAKKGFLRGHRLLHLDPTDRLIGQIKVQVVIGLADVGLDWRRAIKECGPPVVRDTADEAIELLEAQARGPAIERARLGGLPVRHVMILPKPSGVVAVELQHLTDRGHVLVDQAVVTIVARGHLHHDAGVSRVVVASSDECRARRAAHRSGVEAIVAQSIVSQFLNVGRSHGPPKGARGTEPHVVQHDQQHVRGPRRRGDGTRERRLGFFRSQTHHALERFRCNRQHRPIDRSGLRRCLLSAGLRRCKQQESSDS